MSRTDPNAVIPIYASGDKVDIVGPFFVSCDHGCAHGWLYRRRRGPDGSRNGSS